MDSIIHYRKFLLEVREEAEELIIGQYHIDLGWWDNLATHE